MHPTHYIICLSMSLLFTVGCEAQPQTTAADFVIENVHVVPLNEEVVLQNRAIAVRDGEIIGIVDQSAADNYVASQRIDGGGRYVMPGLADMHIHMRMNPQAAFNMYLANGVTTVTNMGLADSYGDFEIDHVQLRADVAAGRMAGPRYRVSGSQLTAEQLATVANVAPLLDRHGEQGYDVIKIHGDLSPDVYDALIKGAHERGFRVTGHTQHLMPLEHSLRMDSIQHVEEFAYVSRDPAFGEAAAGSLENFIQAYYRNVERMEDPVYRATVVREVAESGIYIDATLIIYKMLSVWADDEQFSKLPNDELLAYLPKSTVEHWLGSGNPYRQEDFPLTVEHLNSNFEIFSALLFELHEAGVPLLLGTDAFGTLAPGFSIHRELELMVVAGLTPYEALRTGTVNVAAYLDQSDTAGTIEVGQRADFILVEGNPLIDIANSGEVRGVYLQNTWHSQIDLVSLLDEARALSAISID